MYAIVISYTASDGCKQIGRAYNSFTASFDPSDITTYNADGSKDIFNSADMPCGPEGVDLNGQPYQPWFAPPPGLFDQMGGALYQGVSQCTFPAWIDPPIALPTARGGVSGPDIGAGPHPYNPHHPRNRRAPAAAHDVPHAPAKTSGPV